MKILLVTQYFYPAWDYGGPVAKITSYSKHLAEKGHDVTVLTSSVPNLSDGVSRARGEFQRVGDVNVYYLRSLVRYRGITLNPGVIRFCCRYLRRFEIIHMFGLYDLLGWPTYCFARLWGLPYVVEPLGMYTPAVRGILRKQLYHWFFGNSFLNRAKAIVATSDAEIKQLLSAKGLENHRLILRRNGIEGVETGQQVSRGRFRSQVGLGKGERIVLFLGRMAPIKNLELLLESFAGIDDPRLRLFLVGPDSEPGYRKKLKLLSQRLGVDGRTRFLDRVSGTEKQQLLADADLVVLSSHSESFGNVIAEAILVGVPVLVTEGCGIAPFVKDRVGLVVGNSVPEFQRGLERMLSDTALYESCRARCAQVAQEFGWEKPVAEMEALYEEVGLKSSRRGAARENDERYGVT